MVEINLLPPQYRKSSQPNGWRYATYALVPVTLIAIAVPELLVGRQVGALRDEQAQLQGEITALTPAKTEYDRLTATQTTLESVTAVAQQLKSTKTYWTNDLAAFTSQLPAGGGVALTSMTVKNLDANALSGLQQGGTYVGKNVVREIDLAGSARSQQSVVNFLNAFESSGNFGVNFKNLQRDGDTGRYTFAASVGLVGAAAAPAAEAATSTPGGAAPAAPSAPSPAGGQNVR